MQLPSYHLLSDKPFRIFYFTSNGPKGNILKVVRFDLFTAPNIYNLSFGDVIRNGPEFDDQVVSDNGDRTLVLATIAQAVLLFISAHPGAQIYAEGSTASRTRLYQMGINKYFSEVDGFLKIFGETEESWEPYQKGKIYKALLAAALPE